MTVSNKILACHHIELQNNCQWCDIDKRHSIRTCDRCCRQINTDVVCLAITGPRPQLICANCYLHDRNAKGVK